MGEFKRDMRTIYTRTANTIRRDRTQFVLETVINGKEVIVIKLTRRVKRVHYICYFKDDLTKDMQDWEDVIVLTEIENTNNRFRMCIKPSIQFPHLNLNDQEIHVHFKKLLT